MASKRPASPALIPNPFIKKRNLEWTLESPSQDHDVARNDTSHEAASKASSQPHNQPVHKESTTTISTAGVEAGETLISDHLAHFSSHLSKHVLSASPLKLLSIPSYAALYEANAGSADGAHFVIHQHDHPVAGTHYDLRLQINGSSSVSWAIMYGLPGDPNSVRLNRNATETRIHCLWNHLVETASSATGSLLIWDTGTYSILPRKSKHAPAHDPSSPPSSPPESTDSTPQSLLHAAFQNRKIRLRLHGARLPDPYVVNLRITKTEDARGRVRNSSTRTPKRRRRRGKTAQPEPETSSDEDGRGEGEEDVGDEDVVHQGGDAAKTGEDVSAIERELRELEDEEVRRTNAYPGASNSIGSTHQRRWYLSLDRQACGFTESRKRGRPVWEQDKDTPSTAQASTNKDRLAYPFYVRGANHERSIVTGRLGKEILHDEGVTDFVARKGWNPVLN